MNFFVQNNLD